MNENKFDNKGKIYAKARPGYPDDMFRHLMNNGIISNHTVAADIGSGTGIFTERLCNYVSKVFAVEPNDDMRAVAEMSFAKKKNIISIKGTAENTALECNSINFVTVAQAFHWFDKEAFKKECKRILKIDGKILLVWNDRDISDEFIKENFEINRRFCPNFKGSSNGFNFSSETFTDFFNGKFESIEFKNDLIYNEETFIFRNLSSSYAPKSGEKNYNKYVSELLNLFKKFSCSGTVKYPYVTRCYIGRI